MPNYDDYGTHSTPYGFHTDDELYAEFRSSHWSNLSSDARLSVMQEAVNRSAQAHGEKGACTVEWFLPTAQEAPYAPSAKQGGGKIYINANEFANAKDMQLTDTSRQSSCTGMTALEALLHEDEHAFQQQGTQGIIPVEDKEALQEYKANGYTSTILRSADGSVRPGLQYIRSDSQKSMLGYYIYVAQATERDAFKNSQAKAREIMDRQTELIREALSKNDNSKSTAEREAQIEQLQQDLAAFIDYQQQLQAKGFDALMKDAQDLTQNPEFEKDVNRVLSNHYHHKNEPLKMPSMRDTVEKAMKESFDTSRQINSSITQTGTANANTPKTGTAYANIVQIGTANTAKAASELGVPPSSASRANAQPGVQAPAQDGHRGAAQAGQQDGVQGHSTSDPHGDAFAFAGRQGGSRGEASSEGQGAAARQDEAQGEAASQSQSDDGSFSGRQGGFLGEAASEGQGEAGGSSGQPGEAGGASGQLGEAGDAPGPSADSGGERAGEDASSQIGASSSQSDGASGKSAGYASEDARDSGHGSGHDSGQGTGGGFGGGLSGSDDGSIGDDGSNGIDDDDGGLGP